MMEENRTSVPYIVYESAQARAERRDKRFIVALIIITIMMFVSNICWLWAWSQYDYMGEEITVDSKDGGNANYIGHDGDINNGEGYSETENEN